MGLKERAYEVVKCIYLGEYRDRWRAFVNTVMNLKAPLNAGNFLTENLVACEEGLGFVELLTSSYIWKLFSNSCCGTGSLCVRAYVRACLINETVILCFRSQCILGREWTADTRRIVSTEHLYCFWLQ